MNSSFSFKEPVNPLLEIYIKKEKSLFPVHKIKKIIFFFLIFIGFTLVKGGKGFPSILGIKECSFFYHFSNFLFFLVSYFFIVKVSQFLLESEIVKNKIGFAYTNECK
jgi:hypothetical protein